MTEGDHVIWGHHNVVVVFNGYLPLGVLDRGNTGAGTDGICTRHVTDGNKGTEKGLFEGN